MPRDKCSRSYSHFPAGRSVRSARRPEGKPACTPSLFRALRVTPIKTGAHTKPTGTTPTQLLIEHKPYAGRLVLGWVTTKESCYCMFRFYSIFHFPFAESLDCSSFSFLQGPPVADKTGLFQDAQIATVSKAARNLEPHMDTQCDR